MLRILAVALSLLSASVLNAQGSSPLAGFVGKYTGLVPTDSSSRRLGEFELIISNEKIEWRRATGTGVDTLTFETGDYVRMTSYEVAVKFKPGYSGDTLFIGFRSSNAPMLLFSRDPSATGAALIARVSAGDSIGPAALLLSSDQVASGGLELFIAEMESHTGKGTVARLRNDGYLEKPYRRH